MEPLSAIRLARRNLSGRRTLRCERDFLGQGALGRRDLARRSLWSSSPVARAMRSTSSARAQYS